MKRNLLKLTLLFSASIICLHASAQSRMKKNYLTDDGTHSNQLHKKASQTFLQSVLAGYYFEGFENTFPPAGWRIVDVLDSTSGWISSDFADYPDRYEGLLSAHCQYSPAGPGGEDWFIAPKFTVAAGDSLSFQFKFEYLGYPPDTTFILVSTIDSALTSFINVLDFIPDTVAVAGTVLPLWTYKTYSLNAYAGQDIYVAFRNKNTLGDGIFIDNVELGTRPAAEVAVKSIDMDIYYPSGNSLPTASVKNYGNVTQTFNATMTITGGYTSTKSITVPPQVTSQISFDTWNPIVGTYSVNVQTFLGGDANPANDTLTTSIKVLEPFENYGWSIHDPLVEGNVGGAAVSVCTNNNSRYFLMGGYTTAETNDAYEYDLSFATWSGINPMPSIAQYAASAKANGKLFVFGGQNATAIIGTTQIYDYSMGAWITGTPMPIPVSSAAFGIYNDTLVYIIGGITGGGVGSNTVQIYNAFTDTWITGTAKPGDPVFGCRGGIVNNKIVVAGGYSTALGIRIGTTYVGVIDIVDPSQISWTQVDDYPAGITSKAGTSISPDINSGLVVFTGGTITNTSAVTNKTFAYDVNSNSWKLGPDKPTALELFYMTPVLANDSIYLAALGGGDGFSVHDKNEWLNLGYFQLPTNVTEGNFVHDVTIFPNPAGDATTISLNLKNASHVKIDITDVIGKTVMNICDKNINAGKNNISISTRQLATGMYFCVMNVNGKILTKKLFKN